MSKKNQIILFLLVSLISISAQNSSKIHFHFTTGFSLPAAHELFSKYWKPGLNLGAGLGFRLSSKIMFRTSLNYSKFIFDENKRISDYGVHGTGAKMEGVTGNILSVVGNLQIYLKPESKQKLNGKIFPYFICGAGLSKASSSDYMNTNPAGLTYQYYGDTEYSFMISVGLGSDFKLDDRKRLFFELRYNLCLITDDSSRLFQPSLYDIPMEGSKNISLVPFIIGINFN